VFFLGGGKGAKWNYLADSWKKSVVCEEKGGGGLRKKRKKEGWFSKAVGV